MTTANKGANNMPTLYIDKQQRILCQNHAHPNAAARKSLGFKPFNAAKYHPADVAALARASGGTIGCETCRAIAARANQTTEVQS